MIGSRIIIAEYITERMRRRWKEQPRVPNGDERRVASQLHPRSGNVSAFSDFPLSHRVLLGVVGLSGSPKREGESR